MNKVLLIDKPVGWTSFDVVAKIRRKLKKSLSERPMTNDSRTKVRVGHAGTLDPFATGLLIVLVGDATKDQDKFMKLDKEYEATLKLGYTSTTGDPEGEYKAISNKRPEIRNIKNALKKFEGSIKQTPPQYSAIKIKGKPAYKYAREGKTVAIKPRTIILYSMIVRSYEYPSLKIKVKCSSGTYIRTLAEDIGKDLGCGAYLTDLKRTKIGKFELKNAKPIDSYLT